MPDPVILSSYDGGRHNADLDKTISRLDREHAWKDMSCVMITPGRSAALRVVAAWENIMTLPNNRFVRMTPLNLEVGEAYSRTIEGILAHSELCNWKYVVTRETDNIPPPDGLVNLLKQMEEHPEFAAIGGLYFTKGAGGVAQIWGDPNEHPFNFRPQKPVTSGGLRPCNGTGMGWTAFRLSMFKDERLRRPWFKSPSNRVEGTYTQDLYFWGDAYKYGYKAAVDCSIRVGHLDESQDIVW